MTLKSGKRISKTLPTKSEARDWLQQKMTEAKEALDAERTLGEYMLGWFENHSSQLKESTRCDAASIMLNHGIPLLTVSYIPGHSQPSTTLNMYGHQFSTMELQAACLVDDIFAKAQPSPLPAKFLSVSNLKI
ncbi:MAG: hypothetical protein HPY76_00650 [Anaerolineae bacterium]|nr:hypothetical protein [Anaerolineae bacterium]